MARPYDPVNILVVDDLATQRLTVEAALAELGERVVSVESGRDALRFLLEQDAAVVLLDVNMPEMDGFETAGLIRQRARNAHTPIIFLTANADEVQAARGYALGAVDYLICPFPPDILRTKVKVFVALSRASEQVRREAEQRVALTREQAARAAAEEQSNRLRVLVEIGSLLTRAVDGSPFERELLSLFVPLLAEEAGLYFSPSPGSPGTSTWLRAPDAPADPGRLPGTPPPRLAEAVSEVLATGQARRLHAPGSGAVTGVALPLSARGGVYGALGMRSSRAYTAADLELLEIIAGRTAGILENRRLYRELYERDRRKDEFLAMLSHELRNPLGAIASGAQVLQLGTASREMVERAGEVITRQSRQLARMLDDLLEVSRVTTGRVQLSPEPFDLAEVTVRCVEALESSGRLNGHRIEVRTEQAPVEADVARTDQIITNLLVNAVKYTDPGGRIDVRVGTQGPDAYLEVSDNGIGISAELLPRLFEVFVQGRQALDRAQGGLGIGLALVRKLTELQGGRVEARSPGPGQGSTFTIRLPRAASGAAPVVERRTPRMLPASLKVLVVDDNADVREMMRAFLELVGHEVHQATSGPGAVETARRVLPDLALVDLGLPGFDGLEVARRLGSDPLTSGILLVAMTGYGQPEDRHRAAAAGFKSHLVKPVTAERLNEVIALCASRVNAAGA